MEFQNQYSRAVRSGFGMSSSVLRTGLRMLFVWMKGLFLAVSLFGMSASLLLAQPRPYIGFVYPAGGQQGTTFRIRLGGQTLDEVSGVLITGAGVSARITDNYRRLNTQEMQLLNEQLRTLRRETMPSDPAESMMADKAMARSAEATNALSPAGLPAPSAELPDGAASVAAKKALIDKIERRTSEYVPTPASQAIASLVLVEVTIAADAEPGEREIRLATLRGISNPLSFHVGQLPEFSRKPMVTATIQVLGKEAQALRKRLPSEVEDRVTLPCTLNGQIASGEVNRYRFEARAGQRLVITTLGRQLVPFIADAVPGWFQPVLTLYDSDGKEAAYDDDYGFNPDPTIFYEVPRDGEYVLVIRDSLYRGREDFVYRITMGELPFITSLFPLGCPAGAVAAPKLKGWNLQDAELSALPTNAAPGTYSLAASRKGFSSNRMPFALGDLPEIFESEPNNTPAAAQKVTLPTIINGRIDKPDDWDVYEFTAGSNDAVAVEVQARRLDSPMDSVIKLTDSSGNLLAFNDDYEDLAAGLNTHHADSYFMARLPAAGRYFVHIGDIARQGGEQYGYRLRISRPNPDFALRVVPSSLALRSRSTAQLTVYVLRKDGFTGPIKLGLKNPPEGLSAAPMTISATQAVARLSIRTTLTATEEPVALSVVGTAVMGEQAITHEAVAAEDKMQAFLWRHLVPARDLRVLVFDPAYQRPPRRIAAARKLPAPAIQSSAPTNIIGGTNLVASTNAPSGTNAPVAEKPKFTKQQVAARLRQLKWLFEEGLLTDDFYNEKVAECEAAQ